VRLLILAAPPAVSRDFLPAAWLAALRQGKPPFFFATSREKKAFATFNRRRGWPRSGKTGRYSSSRLRVRKKHSRLPPGGVAGRAAARQAAILLRAFATSREEKAFAPSTRRRGWPRSGKARRHNLRMKKLIFTPWL